MTDKHLKQCLNLCLSNYKPPFSKLPQDMKRHASTCKEVNAKHILTMVNCFSLRRSTFKKRKF
jgi:hypothetical protein